MKSNKSRYNYYSLTYLRQVNNDESFIRHFSHEVLKKIPRHVVQVLSGTVNGDRSLVLRELHHLRSLCHIYEMNGILSIIAEVEQELQEMSNPEISKKDTVDNLVSELERFCHDLAYELDIQL